MDLRQDHTTPTWAQYVAAVEHRDLVAACAVLEVTGESPVRRDAIRWLGHSRGDGTYVDGVFQPNPTLDWERWVTDVDTRGRGWSRGEGRLYAVVAGLAADRPIVAPGVLDHLAEWADPIWQVLSAWGTGMPSNQLRGQFLT